MKMIRNRLKKIRKGNDSSKKIVENTAVPVQTLIPFRFEDVELYSTCFGFESLPPDLVGFGVFLMEIIKRFIRNSRLHSRTTLDAHELS